MRKKLLALALLAMLFITTGFTNEVKVYVGNQLIEFPDQQPIIENDRVLVPVRFIAEHLGAEVEWNQEKQEVFIRLENKDISLIIGESKATVNGETVLFDTVAQVYNGRTMVPLRFVVKVLGKEIYWNHFAKTVYIVRS